MPVWTVDLVLPECNRDQKTVPEYTASVTDNLAKASETVKENLHKAAVDVSTWYNNKAKPKSFSRETTSVFITPTVCGQNNEVAVVVQN